MRKVGFGGGSSCSGTSKWKSSRGPCHSTSFWMRACMVGNAGCGVRGVWGVWGVGCGMWDVGCGEWDVGGVWDMGCGVCGLWGVGCETVAMRGCKGSIPTCDVTPKFHSTLWYTSSRTSRKCWTQGTDIVWAPGTHLIDRLQTGGLGRHQLTCERKGEGWRGGGVGVDKPSSASRVNVCKEGAQARKARKNARASTCFQSRNKGDLRPTHCACCRKLDTKAVRRARRSSEMMRCLMDTGTLCLCTQVQ